MSEILKALAAENERHARVKKRIDRDYKLGVAAIIVTTLLAILA